MAISRALKRLLRIRDLEEEQSEIALNSAMGELRRLEQALVVTGERKRLGRAMMEQGIRQGELFERVAGIEEQELATRMVRALEPRLAAQQNEVRLRREAYMEKRVERRQVETLLEEAAKREQMESDRRTQQGLDDWFSSRQFQQALNEESSNLSQTVDNDLHKPVFESADLASQSVASKES